MSDLPESAREAPARIAVCQHPNGEGVWWRADERDATCIQDCDCTPVVYARAPVSPAVEEGLTPEDEINRLANDLAGDWRERAEKAEAEVTVWKTRLVDEVARLRAELERLRAETLRQGKRITAQDALLVASEERIERYRELLGKVPPHIMELRNVAGPPSGKETPEP